MLDQLLSWDTSIFQAVNGYAGDWTLDRIVDYSSNNNLLKCMPFVAPLWYFWFQRDDRQSERRDAVICLIFGVLITLIVNRALASFLPFRVRPMYASGIAFHALSLSPNLSLENWSSFPSGNATFFFAIAAGVYFIHRSLGVYLAAYAAIFVCIPRIYEGVHYPGDIAVGAATGVVVMIAVMMMPLTRRLFFSEQIRKWADIHSGIFAVMFFVTTFEMVMLYGDLRDPADAVAHLLQVKGIIARVEGPIFMLGASCIVVIVSSALLYQRYRARK
jgi:membrane-associated phospholipid phosphatase